MKLERADFKRLQWSMVALVLAIMAGAVLVSVGYYQQNRAANEHRLAQTQQTETRGRLAQAAQEEAELREKIARYQDLQAKGYIGKESRLDWVEQIARIAGERKLVDLGYEFLPQRPADTLLLPAGPVAGGHGFLTSTQRISLKLLHEGDLLGLIKDLRANIRAVILVRSCGIERLPANSGERKLGLLLAAECELDWITAQPNS